MGWKFGIDEGSGTDKGLGIDRSPTFSLVTSFMDWSPLDNGQYQGYCYIMYYY